MEPKEIIAYLKGAINLGKISSLNKAETEVLKNMLNVTKSDKENKEKQLCFWILGYLDCLDTKDVPVEKFSKIAMKINNVDNNFFDQKENSRNMQIGERLPGGAIAKC